MNKWISIILALFISSIILSIVGFFWDPATITGWLFLDLGWILFGVMFWKAQRRKKKPFRYIGDDPENRRIDY